jgi:hypothetical protein
MLANATYEALQAKDNDLALAAVTIDNLKTAIITLRADINYQRGYISAKRRCELPSIGDQIDQSSKTMRRQAHSLIMRKIPASSQGSKAVR